ncbi:lysosomal cobalamin transporter ABCD4 [Lepeophtheirus salmonis]|uniref:lysosomal cobalamin transporter ABCD4 n=1 Tax=Lepeophtheirus salmonis TaxID=72036 RepID=UPI001AE362E8|nr:lysosomal cobalamin transporter ABCD4-like [Lepeophtheirus salmonis]
MKNKLSSVLTGNYRINWKLFVRIGKLHAIISRNLINIFVTICLLGVCILEQYVGYKTGLVAGAFYEVLLNKDTEGFKATAIHSFGVILGIAVVKTVRMYVAKILSVFWRRTLTTNLHNLYFDADSYYKVNVLIKELGLDNPDQRMTSDVDTFCLVYGEMIARLIISPFTIGFYTWDAYTRSGWIGPIGVFIYFILGCFVNLFLMSPVSQRVFFMEKNEGDFRFKHMFLREKAEEIAFSNSAIIESIKTNKLLKSLIKSQLSVYTWEILLDLWINIFDYVGAIISYLIIAVPVFTGFYDSLDQAKLGNQISQNSFVCMTLIYNLSQLVDLASKFANMAGVTHRMIELVEILEKHNSNPTFFKDNAICTNDKDPHMFETMINLENIILKIPSPTTPRVLIDNLNLSIKTGDRILITGASSSGKTSLLRLIRGLWPTVEGSISFFTDSIEFLSQRPLMTDGSLLQNMIYPSEVPISPDLIWFKDQLTRFNLEHLYKQYDLFQYQNRWEDILSPGEMQRICFIRVFYHRPQVVLLDESTASLPTNIEAMLYEYLIITCPKITILSVGHRDSLRKYHMKELQLQCNGEWELKQI